jgi:hypothetical protein
MIQPDDVLRDPPVSFDDWSRSFDQIAPDERARLNHSAVTLLRNPPAMRVLAELERNAIVHLVSCSLGSEKEAYNRLALVKGVQAFRKALETLAADEQFDKNTK